MAKVLAELSAKPLPGSELQRDSGMGLGDCWRPDLGLAGREEEQELAQAAPCLAGCVIRDACSALLLPFGRAKIHPTVWRETLKNLICQQGGLVGLGRRLSYTLLPYRIGVQVEWHPAHPSERAVPPTRGAEPPSHTCAHTNTSIIPTASFNPNIH